MRNLDDVPADKVEAAFRDLVLLGESKNRMEPYARGDYIVDAGTFAPYVWNDSLVNPHAPALGAKNQ